MDHENKFHLGAFAFVSGLLVYALLEIGTALFIVELPLADDWCHQWEEREVAQDQFSEVCVEYENSFEANKQWFNAEQRGRHKWLLGSALALGAFLGFCAFYVAPKVRGIEVHPSIRKESLFIGAILTAIAMFVLGMLFPGPDDWLPSPVERFRASQADFETMILRDIE